jgi:dolichyl-phosphate mannosyltransferase polypeptide 3
MSNGAQLYLAVFMELISFPEKIQKEVVPVVCRTVSLLPSKLIVSFGAYLLFKLGWGVFTFNDVPEAHAELMTQIKEARAELRTKGVDVGADD